MTKNIFNRLNPPAMLKHIITYALLSHFWIICTLSEQHPADDDGPLSEVQTAVGLEVALPCDLIPGTMVADKVQLVIWYKQGNVKPIYTFDARGRPLQQAIPWADEIVFKNKAHFYYDTNPPALRIKNVQITDAGLYKCRVDFHKSPTRNWRINVTVLVPPTQLTVLDTYGAAVRDNVAGPYLEGESINLTCLSSGGIPPPRVSWWREHALIDDSFQVLPDGTVRNILHLKNIGRKDLLTVYTCQAGNGHVVAALSSKVKLDMNLPPLNLLLQGLNHPLVAGVRTYVTCTSIGARPAPEIIWTKGGIIMRGATQSTSSDGNTTISELVLIPVPEDNERQVVCSVPMNPAIKSQQLREGLTTIVTTSSIGNGLYLKDSRMLNVTHAPIVSMNLGAPLDPNNLIKGTDVYLECDIKANPSITRVEWYHNNKQLHSSRGIIISNQTLVLQGISKSSHGQYFCRATNIQGSVSSNEVYLDVKYPPICKSQSTIIRAAIKQTINITCQVESNPLDDLTYKWHFNNSLENLIELPLLAAEPSNLPLSGISRAFYAPDYRMEATSGDGQQMLIGTYPATKQVNKVFSSPSSIGWSNVRIPLVHENVSINEEEMNNDDSHKESDFHQQYELPQTQMVYSNVVYKNHVEKTGIKFNAALQAHQHTLGTVHEQIYGSHQPQERRRFSTLQVRKQQQHRENSGSILSISNPSNSVYRYNVEAYENFGAVSCVASNAMGHSEPCWYHIQPADLPDPVQNCSAYNATANSIQVQCVPGYDGGIQQHFHVQIYDELNLQILYNTSYKYSEFTIKRLPSDSVFVIRVTSVNLQGASKVAYRLRGRTLSAPLLRTASSTAVLVQLTPLLGALAGVIATLILVAICIAIFIKFQMKRNRHPNTDPTTTEADKGSAEPLSRNMGSHSSLEDKNPDVVPQEANSEDEFHLEEKAFDRLNIDSQRILYTPTSRLNSSSPPPPLSPHFAKQYGELSLTTNPAFNLYNTPQRTPAQHRPAYTAPPTLLSTRTPTNIYTRIPGRSYLPAYETRTSPTSPYGSTTTCTMPLLSQQLQQQSSISSSIQQQQIGSVVTSSTNATNALEHSVISSPHQPQPQHIQMQKNPLHLPSITNNFSATILGGNSNYETVPS